MAFPVVQDADTVRGQQGTNLSPWSIPYPTHLASGDLIVAVLSENNSRTLSNIAAGFVTGTANTTGRRLVVAKKVSNGTESGSSFGVTWSGNSHGSWHVFRITAWEGTLGTTFDNASTSGSVCVTFATALSSATPDPPVLDPNNWAAEDALWLAVGASGGATAYPASYTNGISDVSTGGGAVDSARRSLNTSSENPGTFTAPVGASVSATIAIRPGVSAPVYTDTPSGGIILGGSVTYGKVYDDVESGGTVLDGSAVQDITRAFTPSGGLVLGGGIAQDITRSVTPSGGLVLNGSCVSSTLKGYSDSPSGGIVLGGSVAQSVSKDSTLSGGIVLGGSVSSARTIAYTQSGGLVLGGSVVYGLTRAATPSGGLVLGGLAVSNLTVPEVSSAGIVLGGSVVISQTFGLLPSAGLVLGGSVTTTLVRGYTDTPSGGLVLGGSCAITVARAYTVSGGLVLGGSAVSDRTFAKTLSGGLVLGGSVVSDISRALAEAGGLVLGGSCVVTRTYAPAPSGGIVLGGSASVAYTMNCGFSSTTTDTQIVLLLHCDGLDGTTAFPDASPSNHTMTRTGIKVDTAESKFSGASAQFQGTTSQQIVSADSADWNFGNGDFTIDLWAEFAAVGVDQMLICQWDVAADNGAWYLWATAGGTLSFVFKDTTVTVSAATRAFSPTVGPWYHIAVVRSGTGIRLFVNGTQLGSTTTVGTVTFFDSPAALSIGSFRDGGAPFNGWQDEIRISKGIARWTTAFTPPTAPYDGTVTTSFPLSGGIILGGTAVSAFGAVHSINGVRASVSVAGKVGAGSQTSGYAPSGGLVLGGSASTARTLGLSPTGGLVLGGSLTTAKVYDSTVSGGIVLNGSCIASSAGQKQIGGVRANVSVAGKAGGTSLRIGGTRALVSVAGKPGTATAVTAVSIVGVRGLVSVAGKPGTVSVQQPVNKTVVGTRALVNVYCSTDWGCGVRILFPTDSEDLYLDVEDSVDDLVDFGSAQDGELVLVGSGGGSLDLISSGDNALDPDRSSCS